MFATADGWYRAFPMSKKSQAHKGLSLLLQRECAPNTLLMDGAKEPIMGIFRAKCRQSGIRVKQTKMFIPWSNAAEAAIRELKRASANRWSDKKPLRDYGTTTAWKEKRTFAL